LQAAQPINYVVIRGSRSPQDLADLVRRTLAALDSSQTIAGAATVGELIDANSARHRFNMILLLWFAACAAILAGGGVFSIVTEALAARKHEIAIRTALGAQRPQLAREMVAGTLAFVLAGEALGAVIVFTLGNLAAGLLYGVSARDPFVLGSAAFLLFLISSIAAFWPAWSAAGDDPKSMLRAN
jgi:putative ABC transport system permease protein